MGCKGQLCMYVVKSTEWANIPQRTIEILFKSMPKRKESVIRAKEGIWTKY